MVKVTNFEDNSDNGYVDLTIQTGNDGSQYNMQITAFTPEFNDYESVGITDEDEGYALSELVSGISSYIRSKEG